jgi:thymidine kinase
MRIRKKVFVDAIAGAGKTTNIINVSAYYAERGEVPLILTFQKEDRVHVGKRLISLGFYPQSSMRAGVSVYTKKIKDKLAKIYVSNIHSLAYYEAVNKGYSPVIIDEDRFFWNVFMRVERSFKKNPFESDKIGDLLYGGYEIAKSFTGIMDEERFREHPAGKLWLFLAEMEGLTFNDLKLFRDKLNNMKFEYQKFVTEKEMEKPERLRRKKIVVEYTDLIYSLDQKIEDVTLVLIDEGQDWKELWYRKILNLYGDCGIMVFGDTNQAVFTGSGGVFPYAEVLKGFGLKEFVNERFRTTKRAPEGAYEEALYYQIRKKTHNYSRKGEFYRGHGFDNFISYLRSKECSGAVITRTRADEEKYYRKILELDLPVIKSNEEHKWEKLKNFYYGNQVEEIQYSDLEPFLKNDLKYSNFETYMPISKKNLIEYLFEKKNYNYVLDEKFYNLLLNEKEPIRVTTAHRAKGKEYEAVFLNLRKTPKIQIIEEKFYQLEYPVEYVARTRHRSALFTE